MRRRGARARAGALLTALLAVSLAACGGSPNTVGGPDAVPTLSLSAAPPGQSTSSAATSSTASASSSASASASSSAKPTPTPSPTATASVRRQPTGDPSAYAVADPGPLRKSLLTADLLVTGTKPLSRSVRAAVARVPGVSAAMPLSVAALSANGRTLTIAAVDPGKFRRFTPVQSAQSDEVWSRVAGGEVAVDPGLPPRLEKPRGFLQLGSSDRAPEVHIGAYAPIVKQISAVVNYKRGKQLGMPRDNALLVSTGRLTPSAVSSRLKKVVGKGTTMQTLALEFNVDALQTAVLSGASVSSKVGTFTYVPHSDGTVTPDSSWVRSYIRRETVPILGAVTCNKGMLPQLRGALTEVARRGLAKEIHPNEYAGCYYPRFIGRNPANGLSLHSWGIAVDLNVPGNQRGTVGAIDRRVVAIFKRWGFAWGGDWSYTDPMHFEMARVVEAR